MNWNYFIFFAIISLLFWVTGAWAGWKNRKTTALAATGCGLLVFFTFIVLMWISLERPPLRTMGETRLWYSFFLPLAGIIVYSRWRYKWILSFSTLLSAVFIGINLFKPEIHNKTLMPALQSPWFAPHVIVYMFAYALLGAAFVMAVYLLFSKKKYAEELDICDNGHSSPSACSSVPCGPKKRGELTGLGTPKRPGRQPHGWPIWCISTIDSVAVRPPTWPCGFSSSTSCCCKCAGGESTTCLRHRAPASIRII